MNLTVYKTCTILYCVYIFMYDTVQVCLWFVRLNVLFVVKNVSLSFIVFSTKESHSENMQESKLSFSFLLLNLFMKAD